MTVGDFTRSRDGRQLYGNPRDVLLENNWFGAPVEQDGITNDRQPELQFSEPFLYENWLIRFNSFHNGLRLAWDPGARWRNIRVIGNVGSTMDCNATDWNVDWDANAWMDNVCTDADVRIDELPYANPATTGQDFHLAGGPAQDLVADADWYSPSRPDYALATDIDGEPRPFGGARDAGADERQP